MTSRRADAPRRARQLPVDQDLHRLRDGGRPHVCTSMPASSVVLSKVTPIYEEVEGWLAPTSVCRSWEELPEKAKSLHPPHRRAARHPDRHRLRRPGARPGDHRPRRPEGEAADVGCRSQATAVSDLPRPGGIRFSRSRMRSALLRVQPDDPHTPAGRSRGRVLARGRARQPGGARRRVTEGVSESYTNAASPTGPPALEETVCRWGTFPARTRVRARLRFRSKDASSRRTRTCT